MVLPLDVFVHTYWWCPYWRTLWRHVATPVPHHATSIYHAPPHTHVSYRFHFPPPFGVCPSVSVCVTLPDTVCVSVSVCLSISVSLFLLFLFLQHEGRTENDQAQTEMLLTEKWQECCATSQSMTNRSRETRLQNAQCANQTVGTADDLGSLTISFCCNWCTHVPKHYFTWFHVEEGTVGKKAKQMTGMCGVRTVTQRQQLRS